jgi:hypothetical protein
MTMDPADLERVVGDALKRLPSPAAPPTLLARVMAAVDARAAAPWYARPWTTWPRVWQTASAAVLLVVVAGLARAWSLTEIVRHALVGQLMPSPPDWMVRAMDAGATMVEAARIGWRVIAEPMLIPVTVFLCVMTAACALFAAALNRVALGGASES